MSRGSAAAGAGAAAVRRLRRRRRRRRRRLGGRGGGPGAGPAAGAGRGERGAGGAAGGRRPRRHAGGEHHARAGHAQPDAVHAGARADQGRVGLMLGLEQGLPVTRRPPRRRGGGGRRAAGPACARFRGRGESRAAAWPAARALWVGRRCSSTRAARWRVCQGPCLAGGCVPLCSRRELLRELQHVRVPVQALAGPRRRRPRGRPRSAKRCPAQVMHQSEQIELLYTQARPRVAPRCIACRWGCLVRTVQPPCLITRCMRKSYKHNYSGVKVQLVGMTVGCDSRA